MTIHNPYRPEKLYTKEDDLMADLLFWKRYLRLENWDIVVSIKRYQDMESGNRIGHVTWSSTKREATIRLLDPADYKSVSPYDMEQALIHELLHLLASPFDNFKEESPEMNALEVFIDGMSKTLKDLRLKSNE